MARVVLEHVSKVFRGPRGESIPAVRDLSLEVADCEFVVLLGPSGSGKSTTLRLIAGLEELTAGTISLDGRVVNDLEPKDRDLAMVFQNYALYPHMTVFENLAFGLKLRKTPKPEIERRVRETAAGLGLAPLLARLPRALSGGERQRVALGRAIVRRPQAFLFDEPLSNLDASLRLELRRELARLRQRLAATIIYVTHDQAEAMSLGDRLVVLKAGQVQQIAEPARLYAEPANLFVAGFIGAPPMNFFRGTLRADRDGLLFNCAARAEAAAPPAVAVRAAPAHAERLRDWLAREIILGLRPHQFHAAPREAPEGEGGIAATLELVEPLGAETLLHLSTGGWAFVVSVPSVPEWVRGQTLHLAPHMAEAHFFDPATERAVV